MKISVTKVSSDTLSSVQTLLSECGIKITKNLYGRGIELTVSVV